MKPHCGLDTLLTRQKHLLTGHRIALVSHAAAINRNGASAAQLLITDPAIRLVCLMGPEHGFFSHAAAGEKYGSFRHPLWKIPVYSLYGTTRKPTAQMLRGTDLIVVDLQDIGVRCYTYAATLLNVLQAAAEHNLPVIVADRPIPLPAGADGPLPEKKRLNFVCPLTIPLIYGMTPGETARWIVEKRQLPVKLTVVRIPSAAPQTAGACPAPWIPPSPAIRTWECARCYPSTVSFEALPEIDHGRGSSLPFQIFGAEWMHGRRIAEALQERNLPGVSFHSHLYAADFSAKVLDGVRLTVTNPVQFRPARTALHILDALVQEHGTRRIWNAPGNRPEFFDKLWGSAAVREALLAGSHPDSITAGWQKEITAFKKERRKIQLYAKHGH